MRNPHLVKKVILILILAAGMVFMQTGADTREQKYLSINRNFSKIPLYFIHNQGQVNEKAIFYARTPAYTLWITKEGLVFDSMRIQNTGNKMQEKNKIKTGKTGKVESLNHERTSSSTRFNRDVSRLIFIGANKSPEVVPMHIAEYKVNYFKGNERLRWRSNIPTSKGVLYKNIYNNIDLKVYGNNSQIEYDWIVKPGADPENITFEYQNVKGTRIDNEGNLVIETHFGELLHKKPLSYQERTGQSKKCTAAPGEFSKSGLERFPSKRSRTEEMQNFTAKQAHIDVKFKKSGKNTYGFQVAEYDENYKLVIDPLVLVYSTYLGGRNEDFILDMAIDSNEHVYITGYTRSRDFPTRIPYQGAFNGYYDVFVTKLSKEGDALVFSTYIGGSEEEYGRSIAVDSSGSAYVTGYTRSVDFPTKDPFQIARSYFKIDAFLFKLSPQGNALKYSTYLGGNDYDYGLGIAVDSGNSAYITGYTYSEDFPLNKPFQRIKGSGGYGSDAFVTKFKSDGSRLLYSTYLGGSGGDRGKDITVDSSGNAYITGNTNSKNFPVKNPFMAENQRGYTKVFLTKLSSTGRTLVYSTYLGGSSDDYANGIAVDGEGSVYVCGYTLSWDFPTENPYQSYQGLTDPFISKFSPDGTTLSFSTYLGGSGSDIAYDIAVDRDKFIYVTGYTLSTDFPVLDAFRDTRPGGEGDIFITRLLQGGDALSYSTYLGGTGDDTGTAVAVDNKGIVYTAGSTTSSNFPMKNPFQDYQGESDGFIAKLTVDMPPSVAITSPGNGDTVGGTVLIRTEAADDKGIARVDFYINGQLKHSDPLAPYDYSWDACEYGEGTCYIKAAAIDTADQQTTAQITVRVQKMILTLRVSNSVEKAWLVRRNFVKIDLSVENPVNIPVTKYIIYKKEPGGEYRTINEIPGGELLAGSYTVGDLNLEKGKTYTYKAVALAADGTVIAISKEQSIITTGSKKSENIKNYAILLPTARWVRFSSRVLKNLYTLNKGLRRSG